MSKINIDRIVRDIKTRSTSLTPVIEAVCNSIEAIGNERTDGLIRIVLKRDGSQDIEFEDNSVKGDVIAIDIIDNGEGFTEANKESFDTFRSDHKMDIGGKGFGRFMFLKYFNYVTVESIYFQDDCYYKRCFTFGHANEIIENETNECLAGIDHQTGTTIHLSSIKNKDFDKGLEVIARKLVERLLVYFATGGANTPTIVIEEEDGSDKKILNNYVGPTSDIQQIGNDKHIEVQGRDHIYAFTVKIYKVYYSAITNKICLTANKREVTEASLHTYVPEFKETMSEMGDNSIQKNFMVKAYVLGDYLDNNVTTERDRFNFDKENPNTFFELSEKMIYREASSVVKELFANDIQERFSRKKKTVEHYVVSKAPWNKTLLNDIDMDSIPVDISEFDLEMLFQKIKFDKEKKAWVALQDIQSRQEEKLEEGNDGYEDDVNEILRSISDTAKNDLAHYVCQRKKVLDLFNNLRQRIENGKGHKEKEMHSLIFPMIKNDREVEYDNHNLWLLDERFNFTQFVSSDEVISKVEHEEPDLAIFYESGLFYRNGTNDVSSPIAIVEFKRPKRDNYPANENPIAQALEYADKILDGKYEMPDGIEEVVVNRAVTPVYIYIVCDITKKIEQYASMSNLAKTPDNQGYIGYMKDYNAYIEIKSYKKVFDDAQMRNQIFFKKLGIV